MVDKNFEAWLADVQADAKSTSDEFDLYENRPSVAETLIQQGEVLKLITYAAVLGGISENEIRSGVHNAMLLGKVRPLLNGFSKLGVSPDRVVLRKSLDQATLRGRLTDVMILDYIGFPVSIAHKHACLINKRVLGKDKTVSFSNNRSIKEERPGYRARDMFSELDIWQEIPMVEPNDLELLVLDYQSLSNTVDQTPQRMWEMSREKVLARLVVKETRIKYRQS